MSNSSSAVGHLEQFVEDLAETGVEEASVRIENRDGRELFSASLGSSDQGSLFDLASLAKPLTATLAAALDTRGVLALNTPLRQIVPGMSSELWEITLEDLLRHRSGLAAWLPFYTLLGKDSPSWALVNQPRWRNVPVPTYSDLGYILWGHAVEETLERPLAGLIEEFVLTPLGLEKEVVAYPGVASGVVVCRLDNHVEVRLAADMGISVSSESLTLAGTPQDGNARFLNTPGKVSGHAGWFGSTRGYSGFSRSWLGDSLLPSRVRQRALASNERFALGWWRNAADGHGGPSLSKGSFGMVGFTGGSCWVDPDLGMVAVLLCHRPKSDLDLKPWRQRFHHLATALFG